VKYRFIGLLALNTFIAFEATEVTVFLFKKGSNFFFAPPATMASAVWANIVATAIWGALFGFCVRRFIRMETCEWVWLPSMIWLVYGMIRFSLGPQSSVLVNESVWHHFFGIGYGHYWLRDFSHFSLPCLSGLAYSLGAAIAGLTIPLALPLSQRPQLQCVPAIPPARKNRHDER
jgi:hypothetical protein